MRGGSREMDVVFYNINLANGCQRAAMPHTTHTLTVNSGNFLMVDINIKPKISNH